MLAKLSLALLAGLVPASVGIARAQRVPTFEIRNGAGLCLDVHAPEIDRNGGRVQVWECNGYPNQAWQVANGRIFNGAGLCLDVHAPEIDRNGGRVQVWECNDFAQQRWQFVRADRHRSGIRF